MLEINYVRSSLHRYITCNQMTFPKKSIEDQIKEWGATREKGRKSYVIKRWVVPFGIVLPLTMILGSSIFPITQSVSIKAWGVFIAIFEPIFIVISIFSGRASWKYWEKRYARGTKEEKEGPTSLPGARKIFKKHKQLLIGMFSIPIFVLNLLLFFPAIFFSSKLGINNSSAGIIFVSFFSIFILSFLPILNVMVFIKNPICGHGILSNPDHLHRHPDAHGNYWVNAWKIMKKEPFTCLDCADEYFFEKVGQVVEIIKKESQYNKANSADAKSRAAD